MLVWRTEFGGGVIFFGKLNKPCGYWFCQKWLLIISKRPKKSPEWCYFILTPPTDHGTILRRSPLLRIDMFTYWNGNEWAFVRYAGMLCLDWKKIHQWIDDSGDSGGGHFKCSRLLYSAVNLLQIMSFAFLLCLLTLSASVAGPHPDSLFTVHSVLRAPKGVHHLRRGGEAGVPGSNIGEC